MTSSQNSTFNPTQQTSWLTSVVTTALKQEPLQTVSQWADNHRQLSSHDSAEPGKWRTDRTPYLRAIMDDLSPTSPVERVVVVAGVQLGKTSVGLNWLGYVVHQAPGPVLAVQPTLDMAKRFSKQRLDPLFEQSAVFKDLILPPRARDSGNTLMTKEFPGGVMVLTGANSPTGLRSMPVRYLFLDEVDAYPLDAGGEGDPVDLAIRRTETFRRRKVLMVSTPTVQGYSRIQRAYDETDQRRFYVPCAHCGHMDVITLGRIKWPKGRPQDAALVCDECGATMTDRDKPTMLRSGEWRATTTGIPNATGYHISGLYSPWVPWGEIAAEHVRVHKNPQGLQVFVNGRLGECWEDQAGDVTHPEPLMARREAWGDKVPAPVGLITAGVDTQDDRLEVQVIGWGQDEEAWVIDYRVLWGDTQGPKLWAELDRLLSRTYPAADGRLLPISAVAVDTGGHATKAAYTFCRPRLANRIWGIKGIGGPGRPVWPKRATKTDGRAGKLTLFGVGVDAAKDALYSRLRLGDPGPGYIHFNAELDAEYFRQLTGEKIVTRYKNGRPYRAWQLRSPDQRVEALDTFVYAMAALHGLFAQGMQLNEACVREHPATRKATPRPSGWFGDDGSRWF